MYSPFPLLMGDVLLSVLALYTTWLVCIDSAGLA
jgi:hypothetical protein